MKKTTIILTLLACVSAGISTAQVGVGTTNPDSSAVLDLSSTNKGLLAPRLSTAQRGLINRPATGLIIYNTDNNTIQVNNGTPLLPIWYSLKSYADSTITSITATGDISTSSTANVLIPGMSLSPQAGTYLVMFNGQYGVSASAPVSTAQGVIDLDTAYNRVIAIPATNTTHAAVFGNTETLSPGVYTVAGAGSIAGTLTLDAGLDTTAIFIFRFGGAFNTGAGTTVVLANGARARNIVWEAEGAIGLGASTVMKGTLIAHNAAISAAASSILEGRMFSTAGAVSFGPGTAYVPAGASYINLGVLSSFVMFTSAGAIANTGTSTVTGDIGSNAGAITGFPPLNGNIYTPGAATPSTVNAVVTFSIYQNGVLVANSSRTSKVNNSEMALQAIATITAGQPIDVRWKVDVGPLTLGNRILTLVNVR